MFRKNPIHNNGPSSVVHREYYKDHLFPDAVEVTIETQCVSAGRLQSTLRIGSIRATKLLTELEELGIIGPDRGNRPREIFYTMERWNKEKADFAWKPEEPKPQPAPASVSAPNGEKTYCPHCGSRVPRRARVCWRCGKKFPNQPISASETIVFLLTLFLVLRLFLPLFSLVNGGLSTASSAQAPDTVIYNDSDITLYASSIYYGGSCPTINFLIENKAGENITFYCSSFVVDNVMMDSFLWIDVAEGSKATGTLYLDDDVLDKAGFGHISYIEFYEPHISFKESGRNTKYISVDCSFAGVTPSEFNTTGDVLYSQNGVTVISQFTPGQQNSSIPLVIINKCGQNIMPWTSHVTINGYTIPEWHYGLVIQNNTVRYFDIQPVKEDLRNAGIDTIETVSFSLSFLEAGSTQELFSAGQLYIP